MKRIRSILFVPGVKDKLCHIGRFEIEPDAYIIDLEDSIKECDKENALVNTTEYLKQRKDNGTIYVRINKKHWQKELEQLTFYGINKVMLPKTETRAELQQISERYDKLEIAALIETPKGIINAEDICSEECVSAIAFGGEDYLSCLGVQYSREAVLYAKSKIVTCASAFNKMSYDTIYAKVRDLEGMKEEAALSKNLGFTGKLAIHPSQVPVINQVFGDDNIQWYRYLVSQFEKAPNGVLEIEGRVFERPHIEFYREKIKEYESMGGC